jgi:uncharacterized protein YceK
MVRRAILLLGLLLLGGCASTHGLHGPEAADVALQHVHGHSDARAALWVVVGLLIVTVVIVDLVLLPFSYRRRSLFFPCCRWCIHICD